MAPRAAAGSNDAVKSSTKAGLPRVTQHETLHTLNVQIQQTALAALRGPSQSAYVRRGCRYLQSLARKATLRLDTSIKRAICKRCSMLQLPGVTCTTRIKANRAAGFVLVITCFSCGTRRRFLRPSTQALKLKIIARKRRRRANRQEIKILRAKASSFYSRSRAPGYTHELVPPILQQTMTPGKTSQRSRRRAARYLHAVRGGDSMMKPGGRRPHKRRRGSGRGKALFGSIVSTSLDGKHPQPSVCQPQRKRGKKSRQMGERVADLLPYAERLRATDKRPDWIDGKVADGLSNEQMTLLRSMRGDHIVTRGLGRGGMVGEEV